MYRFRKRQGPGAGPGPSTRWFVVGAVGSHQLARAGLLHVPEGRGTLRQMTVDENLLLAWEIRPNAQSFDEAVEAVFQRFARLKERRTQLAGNLSGGEQQMLSLARAIINRPQILLVDEPSLGLSPLLTREVFQVLAEFRDAGVTTLIVEQNVRSALALAHRARRTDLRKLSRAASIDAFENLRVRRRRQQGCRRKQQT